MLAHLQGLQVFVDSDSGWGGVAAEALSGIADEYPSQPVMLYALQHSQAAPPQLSGQDQVRGGRRY